MNCPECTHTYTKVLETRIFLEQYRWTKRKRVCFNCNHRFFTLEMPVEDVNIEGSTNDNPVSLDEHDEPS